MQRGGLSIVLLVFIFLLLVFFVSPLGSGLRSTFVSFLPQGLSSFIYPSSTDSMTRQEWEDQETKRMQDPYWVERYYRICDVECFVPQPLSGREINDYFKSLNISEKYIYVMMQFNVLGADPDEKQIQTLKNEDVILLGNAGGHSIYAKAPLSFLEEKSYNFIRWIGIMSPEGKLDQSLQEIVKKGNVNGTVGTIISLHENLSLQNRETLENINGFVFLYSQEEIIEAQLEKKSIIDVASLSFVKNIGIRSTNTLYFSFVLERYLP